MKKNIIIFIVCIVFLIFFFLIVNYIMKDRNLKKLEQNLINNIKEAAYNYGNDNIAYLEENKEIYIMIDTLISSGYLKSNSEDGLSYINSVTKEPFKGVIYICYSDNKINTQYLEDYELGIDDLIPNKPESDSEKQFIISIKNITTNSITVSVVENFNFKELEYYVDDYFVEKTNDKQYTYKNLTYGIHNFKVVGYDEQNQKVERQIAVSTKKLEMPSVKQSGNVVIINYPNSDNEYIYEYKINNDDWIKVYESVFKLDITKNSTIIARVSDGYNMIESAKYNIIYNNEDKVEEKEPEQEVIVYYNINFDLNGGVGSIPTQKVTSSSYVVKPLLEPVKDGYEFLGWHKGETLYDFASPVCDDFTLIAKWSKKEVIKYQITIDYNDGTGKKEVVSIESGTKLNKLSNPTRIGYEFEGWYKNGKKYDFNTVVSNDFTLVAKWEKNEIVKCQITIDYNDGVTPKKIIQGEAGIRFMKPSTPTRDGYEFEGWYKDGKPYDFTKVLTGDLVLIAEWEKIDVTIYQVTIDYNDGTGKKEIINVESGEELNKFSDPTRSNYEFAGWYKGNNLYDFNSSVYSSFTLKAKWEIQETEPAIIKYSVENNQGKWIFVNNPEKLNLQYLTDNNGGKAIYSDYMNGNAEIYLEHGITNESNLQGNYAIRFYNPNSTSVELNINNCGATLTRGDGNTYIKTWSQYYDFSKCSLVNKKYTIAPKSSQYIYLSGKQTGSGWNDWEAVLSTSLPTTKIPLSIIDGVFKLKSTGKLYVETFFFNDPETISKIAYSSSDNYLESKGVYSGYYNKLPNITTDINFEINDNTPNGNLKVKYDKGNTEERDVWYTHNAGNVAPKDDAYIYDNIYPIVSNNTVTNWGNWAVHYMENITIKNNGTKDRTISYYINAYYGNTAASAIIAFPTNNNLNYKYKRSGIGKWHETNEFEKIWEIVVPAGKTITVPTKVLLGGNSNGTLGRKIMVNN